jgi:hypothetical protein
VRWTATPRARLAERRRAEHERLRSADFPQQQRPLSALLRARVMTRTIAEIGTDMTVFPTASHLVS